jgi:hypothetical protein
MATLRQEQIDEILNFDRTMNRRVLDRTIAQVSSFNDERSAPNNQDIKLEAVIGSLVDKLKASIADALKLIAAKQFSETNNSNASVILALPAGERGSTANDPNQAALEEFDDLNGGGKSFNKAMLKAKRKAESNDVDENEGYRITSSLPRSVSARLNDDNEYLESEETTKVGLGFGRRSLRKKSHVMPRVIGGADPKPVTIVKSKEQENQSVENAFYNIINQYNGIVDKILESTRENGVLKNKRLASSSIGSYFASIIQGLIEPLKHLQYELSLVRDKDIASMFNMMKSLTSVIQQAPPFQKIDFRMYKTPATDYQRMNRDLRIDDYKGKEALLRTERNKILMRIRDLHKDASHIEYGMSDKTPEFKKEVKDRLVEKQKELKKALGQVNEDIKHVNRRSLSGIPYDDAGLEDSRVDRGVRAFVQKVDGLVTSAKSKTMPEPELKAKIEQLSASAQEIKASSDYLKSKGKEEVLTEEERQIIKDNQLLLEDIKTQTLILDDRLKYITSMDRGVKNLRARLEQHTKEAKKAAQAVQDRYELDQAIKSSVEGFEADAAAAKAGAPAGEAVPADVENATAEGRPRRRKVKMGGMCASGKPLADLLARPKQQYNSMQRPISNDDDINRKMVKINEKWQTSNPVHSTPVGSKNPFYAQQEDAKYDFETKLRKENSVLYPTKDARGADVSLLQGEIGGPSETAKEKRTYKKTEVTHRTEAEALRNILNQDVYGGGKGHKKNPGSLRKLVFDADDNDLFDEEELPTNKGFIKEDKDDAFKLPNVKKEQAKRRNRL